MSLLLDNERLRQRLAELEEDFIDNDILQQRIDELSDELKQMKTKYDHMCRECAKLAKELNKVHYIYCAK